MDRRTFLKAAGLGSVSVAYGCNQEKNIFSLVVAPEDMVTGKPTWYASTCTECPAGCGILAKNREGRIIKLEGNPLHPTNEGKLCIRGQSALQAIYDPDRLLTPRLKVNGIFETISFDQAFEILDEKLRKATSKGRNRVKMLSGIIGDPLQKLFTESLKDWKSNPPILYEPYSHDSLKAAHQALFSRSQLPSFQMEKTDFILGFGADFLETWLSPVEYARKFKAMHGLEHGKKGTYVHVGPFMSLTAANADKFYSVKAGTEQMVALGIIQRLLKSGDYNYLPQKFLEVLNRIVSSYSPARVQKKTGMAVADQEKLFQKLLAADRPLVLGSASPMETSLALDMTASIINLMLDKDLSLYSFDKRHSIEKVSAVKDVIEYLQEIGSDSTELLFFNQTNPLFTLPHSAYLDKLFSKYDLFKVSFSNFMDETSERSDLVFPVQLSLESWDAFESQSGVLSTLQPAMGRLSKAPSVGDVFIAMSKQRLKYDNYQHYLMDSLFSNQTEKTEESWFKLIQQGGKFAPAGAAGSNRVELNPDSADVLRAALTVSQPFEDTELNYLVLPSLKLYDGRGANKSWLNEIPDPITNIAWESVLFVHPDTLKKNGLKQGDILKVISGEKSLQAPIYSYKGIDRNLLAMQIGHGHQKYGRFAAGFGSNALDLVNGQPTPELAVISHLMAVTKIEKAGEVEQLPKTDGSRSQYKRKIAVSMMAGHDDKGHHQEPGLTMDTFPLTLPTAEGYDKKRDVNPPHEHDGYRWGMVIDLDRCIGCSACAAACYAENNIGVVGKEQLTIGREMAWLRIERYEDQLDDDRLIFLPMMCQHCDNAPCEPVCPVYAPYHSDEGLNNQIYNRCIGTRFCAQNCPYKVRRFNWHDWEFPKPLNLQLNPNVTVRMRGVMEKCSFCVQRIKEVHGDAKNENRPIRDGEVQPACVQTCPTGAMTFGSFEDKNSAVYKLAKDPRAYQVLGYLNTKPAVIYLKKVLQKI
jgi:anaerobic selenocysteine-containing dehydrogenase/Fe-S-cluster-containing dehydrogenase component